MKIAMIAPPWLSVPPHGYGGIEIVLDALVTALAELGSEVHVYTVGRPPQATPPGVHVHLLDDREQYGSISGTLYDTVSIPTAHVARALGEIGGKGFDIVHDHNAFVGPTACANLDPRRFPPVLHTLHGPFTSDEELARGLPDNRHAFDCFERAERLWFNGISQSQVRGAPLGMRPRLLDVVYNGAALHPRAATTPDITPCAAHVSNDRYFLTLARVCAHKGQGLAARICAELGERLVIAGAVDGAGDPATVRRLTADVMAGAPAQPDLDYYIHHVAPFLREGSIEYVGDQAGDQKQELLSGARALLFPIDWEEPFGMAVIEALAAGTPVVAMRRGALPELIEHGVTGFLCDTPEEFARCVQRIDEIDPERCRESVERRFSAHAMARGYLQRYEQAIAHDAARRAQRRRGVAVTTASRLDDFHGAIRHGDVPRRVEHLDAANV